MDRFGGWHRDSLEVITKLGRHFEKEEEEIMKERLGGLFERNSAAQYRTQVNLNLLQDLF